MPNPADSSPFTGREDTPHSPLVSPTFAAPVSDPAEHATPLRASKSGRRAFLGMMPFALVSATRVRQPVSSFAPAPVPGLYFDGRQAYPSGYHPAYLQRIVHYANALTHMPYKFGGGHASLVDNGYDCSGALSYVFCGAGFLSRPMFIIVALVAGLQPALSKGRGIGRTLIFAAVLGAIMSTADSTLLSLSSMVTKDLYAGFVKPEASQHTLTNIGKWTSTIIVVVLASFAIYMNSSGVKFTLVELLEMKFDMLLQIAPAFLIGLHWKGMKSGPVFAGMLIGLLFALSFFWVDDKSGTFMASLKTIGFHPGIWALGLNTVIAVSGSWVVRNSSCQPA